MEEDVLGDPGMFRSRNQASEWEYRDVHLDHVLSQRASGDRIVVPILDQIGR
jgi:hypothetical protein